MFLPEMSVMLSSGVYKISAGKTLDDCKYFIWDGISLPCVKYKEDGYQKQVRDRQLMSVNFFHNGCNLL